MHPPIASNGDRARPEASHPRALSGLPTTPDRLHSPLRQRFTDDIGSRSLAAGGTPVTGLLLRILACLAVALIGVNLLSQAAAELPARPEVSLTPSQTAADGLGPWRDGDYLVQPLARYDVTARVLSSRIYSGAREAEVSPIDFALGWGPMADRALLQQLSVRQENRWYYVRWRQKPVKAETVIANSANTHLLPANPEIAAQLESVQMGDVVRLTGYLVRVTADDGWSWTSSTERTDTGDGSCEVLWVESVEVYADDPITYAALD